jgi:hypothetical protein
MEEASYLSDLNSSNPSQIVKLNVGGCKFTTTVATLTCVGGSYFDALFSGRWKQHLTEVGFGKRRRLLLRLNPSFLHPAAAAGSSRGS